MTNHTISLTAPSPADFAPAAPPVELEAFEFPLARTLPRRIVRHAGEPAAVAARATTTDSQTDQGQLRDRRDERRSPNPGD